MVKIYIDPGHGGNDSGATGNGLQEKNITLQIALKVRDELKKYNDATVKMSRTKDETVSLQQRTNEANSWNADYFVSIHINSGGGTGFESYIYNQLTAASKTAKMRSTLHNFLIKTNELKDRGKKKANFHVLRESNMAAVLTENGFIDTRSDAAKLKDAVWINKVAIAHANGIAQIFNLKKKVNSSKDGRTYTVKKGDTLTNIAQKNNTTVNKLVSLNSLIKVGQVLNIPTTNHTTDFTTGEKVKVKLSASSYATGETIPTWVKGRTFTVQQIKSNQLLLKEISSWVKKSDITK